MAYAAVVLLMHNLHHSDSLYTSMDQIGSLQNSVNFFKLFLENSQDGEYDNEVVQKLEKQIMVAAQNAQDIIDSHVYINSTRRGCFPDSDYGWKQICLIAHRSFAQMVKEMESITLEVELLGVNKIIMPAVISEDSIQSSSNAEDKLVGVDADIDELLDQLCGLPLCRQVISIVGMGGIGKTTLDKEFTMIRLLSTILMSVLGSQYLKDIR